MIFKKKLSKQIGLTNIWPHNSRLNRFNVRYGLSQTIILKTISSFGKFLFFGAWRLCLAFKNASSGRENIFGDYGTVKTFHSLPLIWQYKGIISLVIFKQNIMRQDELVTNTNYRLRLSNRHLTITILVLATFQRANATEKSFLETSNVVIVNYNFLDPN